MKKASRNIRFNNTSFLKSIKALKDFESMFFLVYIKYCAHWKGLIFSTKEKIYILKKLLKYSFFSKFKCHAEFLISFVLFCKMKLFIMSRNLMNFKYITIFLWVDIKRKIEKFAFLSKSILIIFHHKVILFFILSYAENFKYVVNLGEYFIILVLYI